LADVLEMKIPFCGSLPSILSEHDYSSWPLQGVSGNPNVVLDFELRKKINMEVNSIHLNHNKFLTTLTDLNDDWGLTFKQIADVIEANADEI